AAPFVAPRGTVEEVLAGIWEGLLGREQVGAADDFFALGGHSLLATQLVSRLRAAFGVELPLHEVFAHPVLGRLAARLEAALARREDGAPRLPPITPAPRDRDLPLSFAQERLWFLDRLDPSNAVYNLAAMLRLRGNLRPAALAAAFVATVRRHEALRTSFGIVAGEPVQVIAPPERARLEIAAIDLAALPGPRQGAEAERLARRQARRPFDLARGPLLRVGLLRLGAGDHLLLFVVHHIACDGWSIAVLTREVAAHYGAALPGPGARPAGLPELAVQYADFACWQRAWLTGDVLARHLACWRRRLAGIETALELPADRPRLPAPDLRGARRELRLGAELTAGLRRTGRREGATLFMLLLAAFQAVLARHAQQRRLVVGTPIANRDRAETEGLIGFFVNLLALAGDLSGEPSWRELIARDREVCLEAYAHQELPFEKLVEELAPRRDLSRSPLFQVMLVLQNTPREEPALAGLAVSRLEIPAETARFELTATVTETGSELAVALSYRTSLFDAATVTRWLGHLERALAVLAADREEPVRDGLVWETPLLAAAEMAQLLVEWNDQPGEPSGECRTATEVVRRPRQAIGGAAADTGLAWAAPPDADLGELFAAQAACTPDAPAVRCEERCLTYRQLAERSERLALRLRRLGVGPEVAVGLLVEPSVEAIVGLLGVLAAGGAYVPLDPGAPAERLAAMLEDAHVAVVLTRGAAAGNLALEGPGPGRLRRVDLENEPPQAPEVSQAPEEQRPSAGRTRARAPRAHCSDGSGRRGRRAHPDNLAYVLYTSGSTGRPKGVAVTHRSVVNYSLGVGERIAGRGGRGGGGGGANRGGGPGASFAMVQPLT
ncbi:MAG TPA: condensation domain-containing protein, partial [Thermoanaerobaculia bacterium]|nr:condensation domain-containing protein [Thermoanaerobaculia bacterium]